MKTTIEIDEKILQNALDISGVATNDSIIELALKEYIRIKNQKRLLKFRGMQIWEGNLDELRATR